MTPPTIEDRKHKSWWKGMLFGNSGSADQEQYKAHRADGFLMAYTVLVIDMKTYLRWYWENFKKNSLRARGIWAFTLTEPITHYIWVLNTFQPLTSIHSSNTSKKKMNEQQQQQQPHNNRSASSSIIIARQIVSENSTLCSHDDDIHDVTNNNEISTTLQPPSPQPIIINDSSSSEKHLFSSLFNSIESNMDSSSSVPDQKTEDNSVFEINDYSKLTAWEKYVNI